MNKEVFLRKLKNAQVFLGNFDGTRDVVVSFQLDEHALDDAFVLFAWYGDGDYCGQAFVLFEKNGRLYEVNAGHCSCFGLEGQWDPEETTAEALLHRVTQGYLGRESSYDEGLFGPRLRAILERE